MSTTPSLEDVVRAWESQDPELPRIVIALANGRDTYGGKSQPKKSEGLSYQEYRQTIHSWRFKYKSVAEQVHFRLEKMKELEGKEGALPDRLQLWTIIEKLWQSDGPYERRCLLEIIARAPLRWGVWRGIKKVYKEAEAKGDTEVFGAIAARLDEAYPRHHQQEVSRRTVAYMRRRAWRYLRRQAETLPATYADAAVDVLRFYTNENDWRWRQNWISSHIWFHENGRYSRNNFHLSWRLPPLTKNRAYGELWQRTPRPLFNLLERAQTEKVRQFAVESLKQDFRASLRDVEPTWVRRLIGTQSKSIDEFVVWLLKNVPRFEQGAFRELGLHEPVLLLLQSQSQEARGYAAAYARTYARDIPLDTLITLVDNQHQSVRDLALDLIRDRDPRSEVGLDSWGRLLETQYGFELASNALKKSFGASELKPEWFLERLLSSTTRVFSFAKELLIKVHPYEELGSSFFQSLIEHNLVTVRSLSGPVQFGFEALERFSLSEVPVDFWRRSLIRPATQNYVKQWIKKGKLPASDLGLAFFKSLAFEEDWKQSSWIDELKEANWAWSDNLSFNWQLCEYALTVLGDDKAFSAYDLGREWLMTLIDRHESVYRHFAAKVLVRSFTPADFAPNPTDPNARAQGLEVLWEMATQEGDETARMRLALQYIKEHHPSNAKEFKDRPEALIPEDFLTFDRVKPLLTDARNRARQMALELCRWDFRRWNPDMAEIVELCESPYSDVFAFISQALLAEDKEENARFRLDPDELTADSVYRFCESLDKPTRDLGMKLIANNRRLADPREMFRLTESPDRQVQAFVILNIWSLYRDRGTTGNWKPHESQEQKVSKTYEAGSGTPERPENWPATQESLRDFLRRILFTLAPARLPKGTKTKGGGGRLKPLPARQAKRALIEVVRDLAIEDVEFAKIVVPLLEEFQDSWGKIEHDTCLVALTRIEHAHGSLTA